MSKDFWVGMLLLPAALVVLMVCYGAICGILWVFWNWGDDGFSIKSWSGQRARLAAVIATAKWVKRIHIYGLSIIVSRDVAYRKSGEERDRAIWAIERSIREQELTND